MRVYKLLVVQALLAAVVPSTLFAATTTSLGVASEKLYTTPAETPVESKTTQRVRIPVTLKAWNLVETRNATGAVTSSRIVGQPLSHMLRARIERSNDFYLGDWRIKTTPIRWLRNSQQYQVRLEVFRRLGESGQIEESIGSVTLTGILNKQDDGLFLLNGTARRMFRDKSGDPILDFDAGQHTPLEKATAISRR
jgi:hypothetical protein